MAARALLHKRTARSAPARAPARAPAVALWGGFRDPRGRIVLGTPAPAACPFCDRTEHVLLCNLALHDEPAAYHATCRICGADGPVASSMRTAAMLWNEHGVTPASRLFRLLCGPGEA